MIKRLLPVAIIGLILTLAWVLLSEPPVPTTGAANAYSRSAIGYEALTESLDDAGLRVLVSRWRSGGRASPDAPVMALEPLQEYDAELDELLEQAAARGAPVILGLPKWDAEETHTGWVSIVSLSEATDAATPLARLDAVLGSRITRPEQVTGWRGLPEGLTPELPYHPQLLEPGGSLVPVISADQGVLIGRVISETGHTIYILSDPDLWNTHGLSRPANAEIAGWFVSTHLGVETVVVDEVIHGYERAPSIWRELVSWPLSLFTTHLSLLLVLLLAAAAGRMGPPVRLPPRVAPGLEGLLDNTAQLLTHGGFIINAARRYFRVTTRDLAAKLSLPPGLDFEQQLTRLDSLGRSERSCAAIWRALHNIPERRGAARTTRRALALAQATWTWREEMLNGNH